MFLSGSAKGGSPLEANMKARDPLPGKRVLLASAILQGGTTKAPTRLRANYLLSVPRESGLVSLRTYTLFTPKVPDIQA